jgi:hypothetical protein
LDFGHVRISRDGREQASTGSEKAATHRGY